MSEPPIPSPHTQKKKAQLVCPFCGHEFLLTWTRYWKQGLNSHVYCPQCKEKSHLRWTVAYSGFLIWIALISASISLLSLGFAFVVAPLADGKGPTSQDIIVHVLILLSIAFPIDKYADARFRPLVKPKNKMAK